MFSQSVVKGTISDSVGNIVLFANIIELGTTNSVSSNINGEFEITTINDTAQLQISSIGYAHKNILIYSDTTLEIILKDTIIIGYDFGYNKKRITIGTQYDFLTIGLSATFRR